MNRNLTQRLWGYVLSMRELSARAPSAPAINAGYTPVRGRAFSAASAPGGSVKGSTGIGS